MLQHGLKVTDFFAVDESRLSFVFRFVLLDEGNEPKASILSLHKIHEAETLFCE
jgi:hypothetical protein